MSSPDKPTRKLAAIMFTDIAGYTAEMSKDESKALNLLKAKESILKPLIKKHNGTYVKSTGDGSLSYFRSAIDAAICSVKLQEATFDDDDMNIRVGIHLGDIVFKGDDVFGDGVNVAARIESIAPVGGVCVSKNVYDELVNKEGVDGVPLGLQSLKGVGRLIEVFGLKGEKLTEPDPQKYQDDKVAIHSDDEVPSIAIIPFKNKGAEEDVFYAYGISADLISVCSGAGLIRVAGLNDIEKLDYFNLKYQELSKNLFVRYVCTGMLWKMGEMFQLSIELYDTKENKVVWSDRWQEKWDNLPSIKGNLSDGLLKALDTKPKVEHKVETNNPEAYEFYLKAKHKYEKRQNKDDIEIVRGLINKAIELDDNLVIAKILLGETYIFMGEYDKALEIFTPALKQAKQLGDKSAIAHSLNCIGLVYYHKGDIEKALDYFNRSLAIKEENGDKHGVGNSLNNIGVIHNIKGDDEKASDYIKRSLKIYEELDNKQGIGKSLINIGIMHSDKGDYDNALDYYGRSLAIQEELSHKYGMGLPLNNIGGVHYYKGDYEKALDYFNRSLAIREELGDKREMGQSLNNIGGVHYDKDDYEKAEEYLEKSLTIQKEIGLSADTLLATSTYLFLTYKHLGKDYDEKEIYSLIKDTENIELGINYRLYELLENTSYLETAYNQVQEKADIMEEELKTKFLSYPIPKAIVEEWKKVNSPTSL